MTNSVLLFIAAVAAAIAVWWSATRTSAALPPTVLSLIMLAIALGGPVWEWSKYAEGAGLPPNVSAANFGESVAVRAFLWASIGAALGALLVPRGAHEFLRRRNSAVWTPPRALSVGLVAVSALSFVAWLIGSGPSFLRREIYTQSDGNGFLLRASFPLGVIVGLISMAAVAAQSDRLLRVLTMTTSAIWFIGLTAIGSRTALAFPLVAAVLVIHNEVKRRRIHPLAITFAMFLLALPMFTFGVVKQARSMPHGLLNLPNVVSTYISDSLASTDSLLLPLKQLTASIYAAFPVAEQSARYDVGLNVLIANANVLPGTAQAMELERYWPYEWVPLCFAGTWYGAAGWAGQLILFGAVGWITGYTAYNLQRGRFYFISFLPLGMALLIALLSIQYPSRMVWRIISVAVAILIFSFLTRDRRRSTCDGGLAAHSGTYASPDSGHIESDVSYEVSAGASR